MRTKEKQKRVLKKAPPRKKAVAPTKARKPLVKMVEERVPIDDGPSYETLQETVVMLSHEREDLRVKLEQLEGTYTQYRDMHAALSEDYLALEAKHTALVETSQFDLHKYKKWIGLLDAFRDGLEESQMAFEKGLAELAGQITEPMLPKSPPGPKEGEQRAFSDEQQKKTEKYQMSLKDPKGLYWVVARDRWVTSGNPPLAKPRPLLWNGYQNGVVVATMDWCLTQSEYRVWVGNTFIKTEKRMSDGFAAARVALAAKQALAAETTKQQVASIEAIEATAAAFSQKHAKA